MLLIVTPSLKICLTFTVIYVQSVCEFFILVDLAFHSTERCVTKESTIAFGWWLRWKGETRLNSIK